MTHAHWETTPIPMRKTIKGGKTTDATDVLPADVPPIPVGKHADNSIIAQTSKDILKKTFLSALEKKKIKITLSNKSIAATQHSATNC